MQIEVVTKNVYGNTLIYPSCEKARLFCDIIKAKTFNEYQLTQIRKLGYAIRIDGNLEKTLEAL